MEDTMAFHLEGPWLSTTGKRKGKFKWRSAEQKRQHEELAKDWHDLQKRLGVEQEINRKTKGLTAKTYVPPKSNVRTTAYIPSHNGGIDSAPALRREQKTYTGTKIIGIGTMHKSNAVPIFSDSEAKEISSMRR